ncbi:hypothetical protein WJT86_10135 [Microvirga sp. W0021]|uniref:Phage tail collar domain-containing protein n=1 Tax=Hohaiivirga grylli TaxID=3133970 RepID=A0ABV0BKA1_9HYPH
MTSVLCPLSLQTIFYDGRPVVGAKVYVYEAGTTTPKTVFRDNVMQAAHSRPILTNGHGMVPPIYVGKGDYKLRVVTPGEVIISEVDGLSGSFTSDGTEPNETYPLQDPNATLRTGDILAAFRTGAKAGFVRCNGNTIGNSQSAASELPFGEPAGDTQPLGTAFNLFVHLWELQEVGLYLPVYANGSEVTRGSTAISDWNNNRQLGLPDLRGRVPMGLDGMGGPTSYRLQIQREITTTKGSTEAYVTDADGIIAGMVIIGTGIPTDTIIKSIEGMKLILSMPASSSTSAMMKMSLFKDASVLGAEGGDTMYYLTQEQLPSHSHKAATAITAAGKHVHGGRTSDMGAHAHNISSLTIGPVIAGVAGGGNYFLGDNVRSTDYAGAHSHDLIVYENGEHSHVAKTDIALTGENKAYAALPPSLLLSYYIKL